jgi:hypothetical protein
MENTVRSQDEIHDGTRTQYSSVCTLSHRIRSIPGLCAADTAYERAALIEPYGNCITMVPRSTTHYTIPERPVLILPTYMGVDNVAILNNSAGTSPICSYLDFIYPALNNWPCITLGHFAMLRYAGDLLSRIPPPDTLARPTSERDLSPALAQYFRVYLFAMHA